MRFWITSSYRGDVGGGGNGGGHHRAVTESVAITVVVKGSRNNEHVGC